MMSEIQICDFCYEEDTPIRKSDHKCLQCIIADIEHRLDELENEKGGKQDDGYRNIP